MESYGDLLFTEAVRAAQDKAGMADRYARLYEKRHRGPLDADTRAFIESRDSFYIASISANGWPYVQHRGGPAGFLRVLGPETIGFLDYPGNKQFITTGNLGTEQRVALFLMDYPRKARLKLLGHAQVQSAEAAPERVAQLCVAGQATPERVMVIDIVAMDWNCPKYITPRLTEAEIAAALGPRIAQLETENAALKKRLEALERGDP